MSKASSAAAQAAAIAKAAQAAAHAVAAANAAAQAAEVSNAAKSAAATGQAATSAATGVTATSTATSTASSSKASSRPSTPKVKAAPTPRKSATRKYRQRTPSPAKLAQQRERDAKQFKVSPPKPPKAQVATFKQAKPKVQKVKALDPLKGFNAQTQSKVREIAAQVTPKQKQRVTRKLTKAVAQAKPKIPAELAALGPDAKKLARADIKLSAKQGIPASVLFNQQGIESGWGANKGPSSAGAMGDTQFMPATRDQVLQEHGVDAYKNPHSAAKAQALYLNDVVKAQGGSGFSDDPHAAVYGYNHSEDYVDDVLGGAKTYKALDKTAPAKLPPKLVKRAEKVIGKKKTADILHTPTTEASGAKLQKVSGPKPAVHDFHRLVKTAENIDKANLPYQLSHANSAGVGKIPGPKKAGYYDCSSVTSKILQAAGVKGFESGAITSGEFGNVPGLEPGPGAVTIYYNDGHVFSKIGDRYYGTSEAGGTGGGGFFSDEIGDSQVNSGEFNVVHVAKFDDLKGIPAATKGITYGPNETTATVTASTPVNGAPRFTDVPPSPGRRKGPARKQSKRPRYIPLPKQPKLNADSKRGYSTVDPDSYKVDEFIKRLAAAHAASD